MSALIHIQNLVAVILKLQKSQLSKIKKGTDMKTDDVLLYCNYCFDWISCILNSTDTDSNSNGMVSTLGNISSL